MREGISISELNQLVSGSVKAAMLTELMSGRALTATELAGVSNVSRQTIISHLRKLLSAELVVVHSQGRHKYFRLANEEVAEVLKRKVGSLQSSVYVPLVTGPKDASMRKARSCYDHLAGPLAVALYAQSINQQWLTQPVLSGRLSRTLELTSKGAEKFLSLGIPVDELIKGKRTLCKACLDWSERKDHLSGALGSQLLKFCINSGWAKQKSGSRVVSFSTQGERQFRKTFKIPKES